MKTFILILLIAINVLLAGVLIFKVIEMPQAKAQPIGMSGNYLMVSGEILGTKADAVYIIDLEQRKLHALHYDRARRRVSHQGTRDLTQDLAGSNIRVRPARRTRHPRRR